MRVRSQKLVLANNWPPSCLMYPDRHFAKNYTSKMYKTVKTQTNLPVKICHLKGIIIGYLATLQELTDHDFSVAVHVYNHAH